MADDTQIVVRCTDDQKARWKAAAALRGTNLSDLVREYLDRYADVVLDTLPPQISVSAVNEMDERQGNNRE